MREDAQAVPRTGQNRSMRRGLVSLVRTQQFGLIVVIAVLVTVLSIFAQKVETTPGHYINTFLQADTILQVATFSSFVAIMAVGMTMVIITAGIDLSVGSTYALAGVFTAMLLRHMHATGPSAVVIGGLFCSAVGLAAGAVNGVLITSLGVHPFIITLGTMWVFRGIAFVTTGGLSILTPDSLTAFAKAGLGLGTGLTPVPIIVMILVAVLGAVFLGKTVGGRRIYAVGGNIEASRYSGVPINRVLVAVYAISGLTAGIAAFMAGSYYGSVGSGDAQGKELYVIAAAVVGGASLAGGKGNAISAMLGAVLIALLQQSISTLKIAQEYEWIIIGCAIIIAVVLDRVSARAGSIRSEHATTREADPSRGAQR